MGQCYPVGIVSVTAQCHNIFPLEIQRFSQNMKTATFLLPTVFLLAFVILPSYTQKVSTTLNDTQIMKYTQIIKIATL